MSWTVNLAIMEKYNKELVEQGKFALIQARIISVKERDEKDIDSLLVLFPNEKNPNTGKRVFHYFALREVVTKHEEKTKYEILGIEQIAVKDPAAVEEYWEKELVGTTKNIPPGQDYEKLQEIIEKVKARGRSPFITMRLEAYMLGQALNVSGHDK